MTVLDNATAEAQIVVTAGASLGHRTVSIRTGDEQATKTEAFTVGTIGQPFSIDLNLTDLAVAPGGQITSQPRVLDAAGNVVADAAQAFEMTVTPKLVTGNPAAVNGLTASFPKLVKKLLDQDTESDPNGEFADGDPTDPNYGKETGGIYILTVTLQGTSVKGTADVTVLPSGTAAITLKVGDFAKQLGNVLAAAQQAVADKNFTNIDVSKLQIAALQTTTEFDTKVLAANNVMAPTNGFPFTVAQVSAAFPTVPDDAKFDTTLDAVLAHVRQIRARVDAIVPGAVTQADIDALRTAANTYRSLSQNLEVLNPGPVGVTRNSAKLNALIRSEIPALLDSMTRKAGALLSSLPADTAGFKMSSSKQELAADSIDLDGVLSLFSNLFSIFTDVAGYAKGNIIELAASLANDLINIALANAVNDASPGGLAVDFVAAGGQFSFACPRWQNTYIEGTGFSPTLENNSVAVIGCIDSYALRNLLTLKPSKDLASGIRLAFKIKSLVSAMGRDQSIASNETPDELREGLFGGNQMVFQLGWPRVNQGRIPCTGIVIAFNTESGGFHAVNMNMLPACQ